MASQDSSHVAHGQKLAYFQPIAGTDADNNEDPSRNQALIAPAYSEATTSSYQHAFHEAVYTYLGILPDEYSQTDLALINARSVGTWSRDFAEVRNKYVLLKNSMASPWKDRKQSLGFKLGAELAALVKEGAWLIGHHLSHAAFHEAIISDHGRLGELRKDEHDLIGKIHHDFAQEHQSAILGRSQSDVRQVAAATARRLYEQRAHAAVLALRDFYPKVSKELKARIGNPSMTPADYAVAQREYLKPWSIYPLSRAVDGILEARNVQTRGSVARPSVSAPRPDAGRGLF